MLYFSSQLSKESILVKSFCKYVHNLQGVRNMLNLQVLIDRSFTYEMNIKFNVLCASMNNRIMWQKYCTKIITQDSQREKWHYKFSEKWF